MVVAGSRYSEQFASGFGRNQWVACGDHYLLLRPVKLRADRLDKKIIFRLELAGDAVQFDHFGFVIGFFFFPLPKRFGTFSDLVCF